MNRQISIRTIINKIAITKNSRRTSHGEAGREGFRDVYSVHLQVNRETISPTTAAKSISLSLYLSISISLYLPVSLSPYLHISVSLYLPIFLSPYISISLYPYLPISLSLYLSISLSPYLHISLSPYLHISLSPISPSLSSSLSLPSTHVRAPPPWTIIFAAVPTVCVVGGGGNAKL